MSTLMDSSDSQANSPAAESPHCSPQILQFQNLYQQLDAQSFAANPGKDNTNSTGKQALGLIYHQDIEFIDPFHRIQGLNALSDYFASLYQNLTAVEFKFLNHWHDPHSHRSFIRWNLYYRHRAINGGKTIEVEGGSELLWSRGKVIRQQDFFDGGQMLYQHLPLLGRIIRYLKARML